MNYPSSPYSYGQPPYPTAAVPPAPVPQGGQPHGYGQQPPQPPPSMPTALPGVVTPISRQLAEKTFVFDYTSPLDGNRYAGTFTFRRPTVGQHVQIDSLKSALLDGRYYDSDNPGRGISAETDALASAIAFLDVCLVRGPEWWMGAQNLADLAALQALYMEAAKADPFRSFAISQVIGSGANRTNGNPEHHNPGTNDLVASMVDEKI